MNRNTNHLTLSPVIKNISPTDAAAHKSPYTTPHRLHAINIHNAAKYSGITLSGRYAVHTQSNIASAVHTAAAVSFLVFARIRSSSA